MLRHSQYTTGPHDVASLHNISNCGHSMLSGFRITTRMCVLHCRILKQTAIAAGDGALRACAAKDAAPNGNAGSELSAGQGRPP